MRRLVTVALALALTGLALPGSASSPPVLSRVGQKVTWTGVLSVPDPMGCGEAVSLGCVRTVVQVRATKGTWITMSLAEDLLYVRVETGGTYLASNGSHEGTRTESGGGPARVTFEQVRSGLVSYDVGVSSEVVVPGSPETFHGTAVLAGKAFDREGECFVGKSGVDHLTETDDGKLLHLSVLLVAAPRDVPEVQRLVVPALVDTYSRIGIVVRARVMAFDLKPSNDYPFVQVRAAFGGRRPPGIDAVHVVTDAFAGGFAECLGGIAYPEFGFSNGSLHYAAEGVVPVPTVTAAVIAAHEIGHVLGAQHQMANCAEALPQLAVRPAADGSVGPCTELSPLAAQASETWSTLERTTIRSYVRRYAGR